MKPCLTSRHAGILLAALLAVGVLTDRCAAQRPLYDRDPFDRITLNEQNESAVLEVLPIPFPGRRVPANPRSTDKLTVKLLSDLGADYQVMWRDIAKVELFENMLLEQAERLAAEKKFDDAFEYYRVLRQQFPQTERLAESVQDFLFLNAGDYFRQKRTAEALSVLEELYRQNRVYRFRTSENTVVSAMNLVAEDLISGYLNQQNLTVAQQLLTRLGKAYPELPAIAKFSQQLDAQAAVKRDEAQAHLAAGRLREAHVASRRMMEIWPAVEGGRQLATEVERRYPLVVVGVSRMTAEHDPRQMDNWDARRTGRLRNRLLMEIIGPGPEGGSYRCSLGTVSQSEDRRQMNIQLSQSNAIGATGYDVSRRLLDLASVGSSEYLPAWASLVESVRVRDVFGVETSLRRPHVLPESLLQVYLNPADGLVKETEPAAGPYLVAERTEEDLRFLRNPGYQLGAEQQPAEITERLFKDPKLAIEALRRGEIDVIDRLLPADAEQLKTDSSVVVSRYALPSVHVLIPNFDKPYTGNLTFRRALASGIRREAILKQLVLGDKDVRGCQVISGPFPAGIGPDDPLAYASDPSIQPRKYNPRLAATLVRLSQFDLNEIAKKKKEPPPELGTLVLAHPDDFLVRAVCTVIVEQLDAIGIKCTLKPLPPGVTRDSSGEYDLLYAELAVWEPIVDARRLFADDGLVPSGNSYISLALRRLDTATNWKDAGQLLHELHFIAHNEVLVVPLWQLVDHFAHHPRLRALGDANVTLYQNIEQWQVAPRTGRE